MEKLSQVEKSLIDAKAGLMALVDDPKAFEAKDAEVASLLATRDRVQKAMSYAAAEVKGIGDSGQNFGPTQKLFKSLGEQLIVIQRAASGNGVDERLNYIMRGAAGASEGAAESGGFLVQTDFATAIWTRAYADSVLLPRVSRLPISSSANGIKIPGIDETSRVNGSRFGGVSASWVGEGIAGTSTKPKFREVAFNLNKLICLFDATDELLADAALLTAIADMAFSAEIKFRLEAAILSGTGVGQPLGLLNSPAKVTVAKETGQAASTLVYENILKMWARLSYGGGSNVVWLINKDVEQQLFSMAQTIGTGGVPVYLPPNGISGLPYGSLFGTPVLTIEQCETLGTEGDIILADLSQYMLVDKGGVQQAQSMHVRFLTDEQTFRWTYRVDGKPMINAPLTPYKGTLTQSPFITLATRA